MNDISVCGRIRIRIIVIRIIFEYYSNTELFAHLSKTSEISIDMGSSIMHCTGCRYISRGTGIKGDIPPPVNVMVVV